MPTGSEPTPLQVTDYDAFRRQGLSQQQASARVGLSSAWASRHEKARGPVAYTPVTPPPEAALLLDDFEGFRAAYVGHVSKPWMVEAADTVRRLLASPDPEFLVINCPPSVGKSTLLQDVFLWLLVRDRTLRTIYGADTETNATKATALIKSYLEAQVPPQANPMLVAKQQEIQATRVLSHDFGAFFDGTMLERRNEFSILGSASTKEASVTAYGYNSGVMGNRAELVGWDDLVTEDVTRSPTANATLCEKWDGGLGESRLEPFSTGLLFLVGQRIGPRDLYRYNLDKRYTEIIDGEEIDDVHQYTHIVFKAHFDDLCVGVHESGVARSWPMGCLLDADRLPWGTAKGLGAKKRNSPRAYDIQYQQNDGNADGALIENAWIFGGTDSEGVDRPGCLDRERDISEVPKGWNGNLLSMVTVDPSATNYWGIQWWLSSPELNASALMRMIDKKMQANQFLDYDGELFSGVLEDLWQESVRVGKPITNVVVEINAAQRYLLTTHAAKKWMRARTVSITSHTTSRNKNDPALGLSIMIEPFRSGRVNLPYGSHLSRIMTAEYAKQFTGHADRDDQKMSSWFHFLQVHNLAPRTKPLPTLSRPSWLRNNPKPSRWREAG